MASSTLSCPCAPESLREKSSKAWLCRAWLRASFWILAALWYLAFVFREAASGG